MRVDFALCLDDEGARNPAPCALDEQEVRRIASDIPPVRRAALLIAADAELRKTAVAVVIGLNVPLREQSLGQEGLEKTSFKRAVHAVWQVVKAAVLAHGQPRLTAQFLCLRCHADALHGLNRRLNILWYFKFSAIIRENVLLRLCARVVFLRLTRENGTREVRNEEMCLGGDLLDLYLGMPFLGKGAADVRTHAALDDAAPIEMQPLMLLGDFRKNLTQRLLIHAQVAQGERSEALLGDLLQPKRKDRPCTQVNAALKEPRLLHHAE